MPLVQLKKILLILCTLQDNENGTSPLWCVLSCSVISNSLGAPWTAAHQVPLSMGFPRKEYWSGLPFPSPGNLPDPGIEPGSHALQADSLPSEPPGELQDTGVGSLSLLQGIILTELSLYILSKGSFQERKCKTQ